MATETFDITNIDKPVIVKDPNAKLDYTQSWVTWLAAAATPTDTIANATATVTPSGVIVEGTAFGNGLVTVWLSGGAAGVKYAVNVRVTTVGGRIDDRTFFVKVKER